MELETSIFPVAIEKIIVSFLEIQLSELCREDNIVSMWIFNLVRWDDEIKNEICNGVFFQ